MSLCPKRSDTRMLWTSGSHAVLWWGERHDEKKMKTIVVILSWIDKPFLEAARVSLFWQKFISHKNYIMPHTPMKCVNEWKLQECQCSGKLWSSITRLSEFCFGSDLMLPNNVGSQVPLPWGLHPKSGWSGFVLQLDWALSLHQL